jgi:hypothetical protein
VNELVASLEIEEVGSRRYRFPSVPSGRAGVVFGDPDVVAPPSLPVWVAFPEAPAEEAIIRPFPEGHSPQGREATVL